MPPIVTKFLHHVVPGVIRPMRILWHEITGFLFLAIAVLIGFSTWRRLETFTGDAGGFVLLIASVLFALLLAGYGVSSFLRARKISRS